LISVLIKWDIGPEDMNVEPEFY